MDRALAIVARTPVGVRPLLAALLWLGWPLRILRAYRKLPSEDLSR